MTDELIGKVFQMISSAGAARSKYIEAINKAKDYKFEEAEALIKEGGECFHAAHEVHGEMLAEESSQIEGGGVEAAVSLILVHAEDQMMAAETFRLICKEMIDVYRKMSTLEKGE